MRKCVAIGLTAAIVVAVGMVLAAPHAYSVRSITDRDFLPLSPGLELHADSGNSCGSLPTCGRHFLISAAGGTKSETSVLVVDHLVRSHGWGDARNELLAGEYVCREDGYLCLQMVQNFTGFIYDLDEAEVATLPSETVEVGFSSCCDENFYDGAFPGSPLQLVVLSAIAFGPAAACWGRRRFVART